MYSPETDEKENYGLFRDCLATALIERATRSQPKPRRRAKTNKRTTRLTVSPTADASDNTKTESDSEPPAVEDDLADFVDYIAAEIYPSLPQDLKTGNHISLATSNPYASPFTNEAVSQILLPPLDPSPASDSLATYGIINPNTNIHDFLAPILTSFASILSTPPPPPISTKAAAEATGCELCGRDWINLTYHHLIPRFVHEKVVRRGWHRPEDLQNVAWLCGACHRFVHRLADHEELAKRYYTVELLLEEEEVRKWVDWAGRLRWKGK